MKLRKLITGMLIMAMCFGIAGCGSDKPEKSDDTDKNVAPTTQAGGDTTEPTEAPAEPTEEDIAKKAVSKYIGYDGKNDGYVPDEYVVLCKEASGQYSGAMIYYEYDENWHEIAAYTVSDAGTVLKTVKTYNASSLEEAKSFSDEKYTYARYYNEYGDLVYEKNIETGIEREYKCGYSESGKLVSWEDAESSYEYDEEGIIIKAVISTEMYTLTYEYTRTDENHYQYVGTNSDTGVSVEGSVVLTELLDEYGRRVELIKEDICGDSYSKLETKYTYDEEGRLTSKWGGGMYYYVLKSEYVAPDYK